MFKLVDLLTQGLDGTALRHRVLSNNLANANTPQFQRSDVDFSHIFAKTASLPMNVTHENHINFNQQRYRNNIQVIQDDTTTIRNDGNNVDVEREMVMLMENQLHYQAMTDVLSRNISMLRLVIGERG